MAQAPATGPSASRPRSSPTTPGGRNCGGSQPDVRRLQPRGLRELLPLRPGGRPPRRRRRARPQLPQRGRRHRRPADIGTRQRRAQPRLPRRCLPDRPARDHAPAGPALRRRRLRATRTTSRSTAGRKGDTSSRASRRSRSPRAPHMESACRLDGPRAVPDRPPRRPARASYTPQVALRPGDYVFVVETTGTVERTPRRARSPSTDVPPIHHDHGRPARETARRCSPSRSRANEPAPASSAACGRLRARAPAYEARTSPCPTRARGGRRTRSRSTRDRPRRQPRANPLAATVTVDRTRPERPTIIEPTADATSRGTSIGVTGAADLREDQRARRAGGL